MDRSDYRGEILLAVWPLGKGRTYTAADGRSVEVREPGEWDDARGLFAGAEVAVGGTVFRGDVVVAPATDADPSLWTSAVLHVATDRDPVLIGRDGEPVPRIVPAPDAVTVAAYEMLLRDSRYAGCAHHVRNMESHERVNLFTRLMADRLHRKCSEIKAFYREFDDNWNEAMYVTLFSGMGAPAFKEPFIELARKVRYSFVSKERNSLQEVEALLLGASGLMELYEDDTYTRGLKESFEHLRHKYNIVPMYPQQWNIGAGGSYPGGHPVLRIVQLAAFLATHDFVFDNLVKCARVEDVHNLFRAEASPYWSTHWAPSRLSAEVPKRLGHHKANMLGINMAVPMIFTYGEHTGDEAMQDRALALLEKTQCESNSILSRWKAGGVYMENAFDSQAVLQLNKEYCMKGLCWQCPVGRRVIRRVYRGENL